MSAPSEKAQMVSEWFSYAQTDIKAAEALTKELDNFAGQICFHSQQAVEKAIKAALIFLDVEFPYIHDLNKLRKLLPQEWTFCKEQIDLNMLSRWAVHSRYPETATKPTLGQANAALEEAKKAVSLIELDLKKVG
ncbi:MAG: HEPN domain-containing protein [Cyanobacteria bacterium J06649_4]